MYRGGCCRCCERRVFDIDASAWAGLEETAGSSVAKHHVGSVRLLFHFIPLHCAMMHTRALQNLEDTTYKQGRFS